MAEVKPSVFKKYDIRGKAEEDFTDPEVEKLGRALGAYFRKKGQTTALVGRDNRAHSRRLRDMVVRGLVRSGCDVLDIGETVSPVFYFAHHLYHVGAGVMVTASHNPPEDNGFKIYCGESTIYGEEIQEIKRILERKDFVFGEGHLYLRNPREDYLRYICEKVTLGPRKLKVAVDCGNGAAGCLAPELYGRMGCEVLPLFCDPNPTFPNHHPDPTVAENLKHLRELVVKEGADVGMAFDGDGDRLGVVDERGSVIWGDMLQVLFWREILPRYPGARAIVEVKCSQALVEEVKSMGGKPFFYKTGHSLIKAKMKETGTVFTGEMSGHFFFADEYFGFDDGLYAGTRLLRILSHAQKPLSELLADVPRYYSTSETRIPCAEESKRQVIRTMHNYFKEKKCSIIDVDGLRIQFSDGWGLVRASNTQSMLVARCEAKSREALKRIAGQFSALLEGHPGVGKFKWEFLFDKFL